MTDEDEVYSRLAAMESNLRNQPPASDEWTDFLAELKNRVKKAEEKHPLFADGIYQGAGCISAEHGEFWNAVTKNEGEKRILDENWDVIVTAFRFWRGDWRQKSEL